VVERILATEYIGIVLQTIRKLKMRPMLSGSLPVQAGDEEANPRKPDFRRTKKLKAAGSHWSLSDSTVSDDSALETHWPDGGAVPRRACPAAGDHPLPRGGVESVHIDVHNFATGHAEYSTEHSL
jgi:hypothetical protein